MSMADFLIPHRQQRLLAALLLHPERSYSHNELVKIGGAGRGANQNALRALIDSGVVTSERIGNQLRIRANEHFPLYSELRSICIKSFGVLERLRSALEPLTAEIDFAFLFGSIANGSDRSDSDIDLLVVGSVDIFELNSILTKTEQDFGRTIHLSVYAPDDWRKKCAGVVMQRILIGPKLMVLGNDPSTSANRQSHGDATALA